MRRLLAREMPLVLKRTIIPGDPETVELFDVREVLFDERYMEAMLNFREDASIPESGMNYEQILDQTGRLSARGSTDVTGTYTLEGGEEEEEE